MIYEINGQRLKQEIHAQGLSIAAVGRSIGFMPNYFGKCLNMGRLSSVAINRIYTKYQINPEIYVLGRREAKC